MSMLSLRALLAFVLFTGSLLLSSCGPKAADTPAPAPSGGGTGGGGGGGGTPPPTPPAPLNIQRNGVMTLAEAGLLTPTPRVRTLGFEAGTKADYTSGVVNVDTNNFWLLNEALLGNTAADVKTGTASTRIRGYGEIANNTPIAGGVSTVSIQAARYSTDASGTLELWAGTDGINYSKVGATQTVSNTTLTTLTWTVNLPGNVYLNFYKADGNVNVRLNLDNLTVTSYNAPPATAGLAGSAGFDNHLALGNPSQGVALVTNLNNYLSIKDAYVMCYNNAKGWPNWVAWHMSSVWRGSQSRLDNFRADNTLPSNFYKADDNDWSGSGFDRGHVCPSGDRTRNFDDNSATFFMTNMMAQSPDNNQGYWERLESYSRTLADNGNELYIIAGPMGQGGTGSNGSANTIAGGRVFVPAFTWKVIVVLPNGTKDIGRITASTRVIAIKMPNTQIGRTGSNWGAYRVSVRSLETDLGYNFLNVLPQAVQDALETTVDTGSTS
jgi:endonuclease G, mitochondrial